MFIDTMQGCYINTAFVRTFTPMVTKHGGKITDRWCEATMDDGRTYRISHFEWEKFSKYASAAIVPASPGMFTREYFENEESGTPKIEYRDHPIIAWALPSCQPMTPQHGEFELEEDCCAILYPDGSLYQPYVCHYPTAEAMEKDLPAYFSKIRESRNKSATSTTIP